MASERKVEVIVDDGGADHKNDDTHIDINDLRLYEFDEIETKHHDSKTDDEYSYMSNLGITNGSDPELDSPGSEDIESKERINDIFNDVYSSLSNRVYYEPYYDDTDEKIDEINEQSGADNIFDLEYDDIKDDNYEGDHRLYASEIKGNNMSCSYCRAELKEGCAITCPDLCGEYCPQCIETYRDRCYGCRNKNCVIGCQPPYINMFSLDYDNKKYIICQKSLNVLCQGWCGKLLNDSKELIQLCENCIDAVKCHCCGYIATKHGEIEVLECAHCGTLNCSTCVDKKTPCRICNGCPICCDHE